MKNKKTMNKTMSDGKIDILRTAKYLKLRFFTKDSE